MYNAIFQWVGISALALVSAAQANDSDLTGNRFFDAAASKVMTHNEGFTRQQANCVVSAMTDDGQIGVGEINQMKLDPAVRDGNSDRLNAAYDAALSACKG